jgi:hypothetical protein
MLCLPEEKETNMPRINTITLNITTGTGGPAGTAGTRGDVYLGVCGREFYADTSITENEDFVAGSTTEFVFGDGANVGNPGINDPRQHSLFTEDVKHFPTYIRFQPRSPEDQWLMVRALMSFNNTINPTWDTASWLGRSIWLGNTSGLYVHLRLV